MSHALPLWITLTAEYHGMGAGPRVALQAIADGCEGRTPFRSAMLAFVGLPKTCQSSRSVRVHLAKFKRAGFVVELSHGGGRLASVYGIPGHRGQLDRFRSDGQRRGTGPGGRWTRTDTRRIRGALMASGHLAAGNYARLFEFGSRPRGLEDG